jgi:hypothetical protein
VGPQGPVGPAGPQGPAGTANVIYSAWATPSNWRDTVLSNDNHRIGTVTAPSLTAAVINNGAILTYYRNTFGANDGPFPLPVTTSIFGTIVTISHVPAAGRMHYTAYSFDGLGNSITPSSREYRYVLIPGAVAGGRLVSGPAAGYTIAQLKGMSYTQVASMFNIPANGSNER